MGRHDVRPCPCGSGKGSHWQFDARGIELCRTCEDCHEQRMSGYRRDVLVNPQYECDEVVEPETSYEFDDVDCERW